MMKTNIQTEFDNVATRYDEQRKKFIPCFDDFYECAVESLAFEDKHPHILDLGAGTGLLSQMVLQKHPTATFDLIDLSENMLKVAKERFRGTANVNFKVGDYTRNPFEKDYDAIISSLSIHHLMDADKVKLYANIFARLKPFGIFVNAEQVLGEDAYIEQKYREVWERYVEQSGLSKEEIQSGYERVKLDIRTPLSTQLNWLKDIGFSSVTCLYKHYSFAVMFARKVQY
jgi:tRNA (cmo5U34)-methyltransferase